MAVPEQHVVPGASPIVVPGASAVVDVAVGVPVPVALKDFVGGTWETSLERMGVAS